MSKSPSRARRRTVHVADTQVKIADAPAVVAEDLERTLSRTSASWTHYLARLQDETIHFTGTYFSRCLETMDRFARCRTLADVADAQSRFFGDLLAEFADESALMVSAFCEPLSDPRATPSTGDTVP